MGSFEPRGNAPDQSVQPDPAATAPASCPTCQSRSITTTAKTPDSTSYWRCTDCGEVWNDSRRHAARQGRQRWW